MTQRGRGTGSKKQREGGCVKERAKKKRDSEVEKEMKETGVVRCLEHIP